MGKVLTEEDVSIKQEKGEYLQSLDLRLIVKLFDVPSQTSGGIFIPDTALDRERKKQVIAEVISVGGSVGQDWDEKEKGYIKPGVKVLVGRFVGSEIKPEWIGKESGEYRLINDADIGGVFRKGAKS